MHRKIIEILIGAKIHTFFLKEAAAVSLCETQQPGQTAAQQRYCHNNSKKEF